MTVPKITREDILRLLDADGFGNIVNGQRVSVSRQAQLNRALELACECGYLDLVTQLHELGAEIRGNPEPLNVAADCDHPDIAEYLINHGADIDGRARMFGETPLMTAAGSASLAMFRLLISHGADPNAIDDEGANVLTWASNGRHTMSLPEMFAGENVISDYDAIIQTLTDSEA